MAVVHFAEAVKDSVMTAVLGHIDGGSSFGYFEVYTAPMPAAVTTAISSQTKLGTLTFSDPCGTIVAGELICAPSPGITQDGSADADGTAAWARFFDSDGVAKFDANITVTGGGGALQLNTTAIKALGPIIATSFKFTLP